MPNRLAHESSPYLLQHANNPVDWHPWGAEAIELARQQGKPIFLSIGYSACHWCHVMEHESFEDAEIARYLNAHFISIKVDREERPDLDQIYMNAVQLLTGRGGWPMSVFLTHEMKPFYGGTYWPPEDRHGMPGFPRVLAAVLDAWQNRREQVMAQSAQLTEHIQAVEAPRAGELGLTTQLFDRAATMLQQAFDPANGGFGRAPKFPNATNLALLLRIWKRKPISALLNVVTHTLDKMARGGIYDHLGGGFARYSVDERWLVPHFEKMLYDNAVLLGVYLDAHLATGRADFAQVARETCEYLLRDMTDAGGAFHSTEDADSEGEEGKFYVWTPDEIRTVLGAEEAELFCEVYDVTQFGNFEHHNILNLPKTIAEVAKLRGIAESELQTRLADSREKLLAFRSKRVRPGKDDKIIVAWNGLMIESLARAAGVLNESKYLAAAAKAAGYILTKMRQPDGHLYHTSRHGKPKLNAYLDDYAALANALVTLYEESFDERWIDEATKLADIVLHQFRDLEHNGFFYTPRDHEALIARQKDTHDGSTPSGNALAATFLIRLGKLCGRGDYTQAAEDTLAATAGIMEQSPQAGGQMLIALDYLLGPTPELVLLGDASLAETQQVIAALRKSYLPRRVLAYRPQAEQPDGSPEIDPIFVGRLVKDNLPTLYVCEGFTCQAPAVGAKAILARLKMLE